MRPVDLIVAARDGDARTGSAHTARGSFRTPVFMPVGTRGAVKTLAAHDMEALGAEILLANTYHLLLRPGPDVVADLGGIHGFSAWDGHVLTDSGGYQVFSLDPKVDDDGATFASVYDGAAVRLTPERAVEVQEQLGADIAMVLDVCPPADGSPAVIATAVRRTSAWAARARAAHRRADQSLFGIVQGGIDPVKRRESAEATMALDFDGYAVGGLSVGESRQQMVDALGPALEVLPTDRPQYLMGVGDPAGLVEAVGLGVDMFDCVLPTRLARHGTVLTDEGRRNLRNARWARHAGPLDDTCDCATCARYSAAYLRHLLATGEPTAPRLVTVHNLSWTLRLVTRMRDAIGAGRFAGFRRDVLAVWG